MVRFESLSPRRAAGVALCLLLALAMGCEAKKSTASDADAGSGAASAEQESEARVPDLAPYEAVVTAHSAKLPAHPERIVSLAPNVTELLFAMDAGDRVVAVTRFCDHPPEVTKLPKVGGFIDPDMEAILAQRPDLVVGMKAGDASLTEKLQRAQIPYVFLEMDDIAQTLKGTLAIGEAVDASARASKVYQEIKHGMELTRQPGEKPTVLFVIGHDPLVAAGRGTFGNELVELAGGKNVLDEERGAYPQLDMEAVLALDPQVILDATMVSGAESEEESLAMWQPYEALSAKKTGRIHHFGDPSLLRPGPRLGEALNQIKAALAPPPTPADAPDMAPDQGGASDRAQ